MGHFVKADKCARCLTFAKNYTCEKLETGHCTHNNNKKRKLIDFGFLASNELKFV